MSPLEPRDTALTVAAVAARNRLHYTRLGAIERVRPLTVSRPIDAQTWRFGERVRIR